jgi:hypothetical protein
VTGLDTRFHGLLIALLCCVASACATVTYREPKGGERARVRFATTSQDDLVVQHYERGGCEGQEREWMRFYRGALVGAEPRRLDIPLQNPDHKVAMELHVAAGEHHFLFVGSGFDVGRRRDVVCGVPVSLRLAAGQDYELEFSSAITRCAVEFATFRRSQAGASERMPLQRFPQVGRDAAGDCGTVLAQPRLF